MSTQLSPDRDQFRAVAETAPDAIVSADAQGRITFFNPAAERAFGYTCAEVLNAPLTLLMPERFHAPHSNGFQRFLATAEAKVVGRTIELAARRKDGSEFPIELSLAVQHTRSGIHFTGILRDITERKRTEQELHRRQQELQDYINSMSTFTAKIALDGTLLIVNATAQKASGLPMDQLIGSSFLEGQWWAFDAHVQERVKEAFREATTGTSINYDERLFVFGRVLDISFSLVPVRGMNGAVAYIIAEGRDITALKQTEKALAQRSAQLEAANDELRSFSYSIAHDLRAPLRAIYGFSRLLEQDYRATLDDEGRRLLDVISVKARQMSQLIEDLLAFSRLARQDLSRSHVDMTALALEAIAEVRRAEGERVLDIVAHPLPHTEGDPSMLRQVFFNLIQNAAKFTRAREKAHIEVGCHHEPDGKVYYVADNGVGFDMQYADRLFGVFQRLHRADEFEGTGVGLAIVQRIVQRHGGKAWAMAEVDRGATFFFTLPG